MNAPLVDPADLLPGDDKARAALERYTLAAVRSSAEPAFEEAYAALDAEFAARGELERRAVVAGWLDGAERGLRAMGPAGVLWWRYHLLVARDDAGLAAVRDCHAVVDPSCGVGVVYLAHILVVPAHRGSGLGALLRAAPITLGKRALAEAGCARGALDLVLAAEMEPVRQEAPKTVARLVAYGRAGFAVVPPSCLPYCQADFRDLAALRAQDASVEACPLPLLAVVRWIGHDGATALPARLAAAFVRHLYAVFATHCDEHDLARPRERSLSALGRSGLDPVPLLRLPSGPDDDEALAPLRDDAVREAFA
jgi:GNAT superfamily N-acetyltransferase